MKEKDRKIIILLSFFFCRLPWVSWILPTYYYSSIHSFTILISPTSLLPGFWHLLHTLQTWRKFKCSRQPLKDPDRSHDPLIPLIQSAISRQTNINLWSNFSAWWHFIQTVNPSHSKLQTQTCWQEAVHVIFCLFVCPLQLANFFNSRLVPGVSLWIIELMIESINKTIRQ